ncbi:FAD-dependent oxidoreductase [Xylocopilactobacillus apis]|uniref:FAD dependent oxidoreductase domain-containing protein n=1 Tax=Xylocopilactobacillus apis TaxID=2932183 RepID=A0AAU9DNG9_9LACO|nr:NAD(P)/FAD-dependent oxidoreductase [Xylocopilactobacillus apis]BDR56483.1 hypothetical protein KIMC2_10450 [Xylocopilactobacillus apis]
MKHYDKIIIGGGLYGLYSAWLTGKQGNQKILLIEKDPEPFMRATYINQARVHMGYHYPRSISTAIKSKKYFDRFVEDFDFAILKTFDQIYATSSHFSWTNKDEFKKFCSDAGIFCEEMPRENYFNPEMCDGAFLTKEYTFDAHIIRDFFLKEIAQFPNVEMLFSAKITAIKQLDSHFEVSLADGKEFDTDFILNSSYAGVNEVHSLLGYQPFQIKYEKCEIILVEVNDLLKDKGLTVMDGPFFSLMPFGKTGLHSLTAVTFTPHETSYDNLPTFPCQARSNGYCSPEDLGNCNDCPVRPLTAYLYMRSIAKKYIKDEYEFKYKKSLFSMKPILKASEIDDSRPTVVKVMNESPMFVSVLSGKINTVYDLDKVLLNGK